MTGSDIRRITDMTDWDELAREAGRQPIWLFKHSRICPLSTEARREFERFVAAESSDSLYVLIEVQNARELSREIARRCGVRHETPQVLLFVGETVAWHGSHWDITASALSRVADEAAAVARVGCR